MKTLKDLFEIMAIATEENVKSTSDWFFDYSGHVNKLSISYYLCGWKLEDAFVQRVSFELTEDGIQGAYYFIKTRLR